MDRSYLRTVDRDDRHDRHDDGDGMGIPSWWREWRRVGHGPALLGAVAALTTAVGTVGALGAARPSAPGEALASAANLLALAATLVWLTTMPRLPSTLRRRWAQAGGALALACAALSAAGTLVRTASGLSSTPAAALDGALAVAAGAWVCLGATTLQRAVVEMRTRTAALETHLLTHDDRTRDRSERLHEARSTVAGIRGAHDLVAHADLAPDQRQHLVEVITTELDRLERLVSGRAGLDGSDAVEEVDVDATLEVLATTHRARGRVVEIVASGARVRTRPDDLTTAVNILLENSATHAAGATSRIHVRGTDDAVEILVSDDGPGIGTDLGSTVFEEGVTSATEPGHGIGLPMARRLVTHLGGSLEVAEDECPGATFALRVPAQRGDRGTHH